MLTKGLTEENDEKGTNKVLTLVLSKSQVIRGRSGRHALSMEVVFQKYGDWPRMG